MHLLVNDLSVHEQFHEIGDFRDALVRLIAMRAIARGLGHEIHSHGALLNTKPMRGEGLQSVVARLEGDHKRAVLQWLHRVGPFWDRDRMHRRSDWLECRGEIVTDCAVGEAAFRSLHKMPCAVVSLAPSNWCESPLNVIWNRHAEGLGELITEVENWWRVDDLGVALENRARPVQSWGDVRDVAQRRFAGLMFGERCFSPLKGVPFAKAAAERFLVLLEILDRYMRSLDDQGRRNSEANRIYQEHFTGSRAKFSDSSDSEKHRFRHDLTFPDPERPSSDLFCPWHGKISHSTLRLHFSWPLREGRPLYVVYAGPKITKR